MCWQQRKPGDIYTTIVLVALLCAPGFVWAADFTARQVTETFYKAKQGTQFCRCGPFGGRFFRCRSLRRQSHGR